MTENEERTTGREKVKAKVRESLTVEDLHEAFACGDSPLWLAVMLVADSFREACVSVATDPELSERESNMALGGVQTMDDWKAELIDRRKMAMGIKAQ